MVKYQSPTMIFSRAAIHFVTSESKMLTVEPWTTGQRRFTETIFWWILGQAKY